MKQLDHADTFAYLLRVCGSDLPTPEREYYFARPRKYRADFAWPEYKIAVEIHGAEWTNGRHTRGAGFIEDRWKMNTAQLHGWIVLEFTATMLTNNSIECIDQLRKAILARSSLRL